METTHTASGSLQFASPGANLTQRLGFAMLALLAFLTILPILFIVVYIFWKGLPALSLEFLFQFPTDGMRSGGIWPAILGTVYLTFFTTLFACPLGIAAAIYLAEYAPDNRATRLIRIAIINLAASIDCVRPVWTGHLRSVLQAGHQHPGSLVDPGDHDSAGGDQHRRGGAARCAASLPRGEHFAGRHAWQTIRQIVVPQSLPGILTGVILGLERAAGETAPILFTGAAFYLPSLPQSPMDETMALPYHLYVISTQVPGMPAEIQYGTALVLLILVLGLNLLATIIRSRARARRQW